MSPATDVEPKLLDLLKSYDRIGFGRRGVLDAEAELRELAAALSPEDQSRFRQVVLSWIEPAEAERVTATLHYNLPEHLQALAIRLCASLPIPESLPLLRRLQRLGAFRGDDAQSCREALSESLARLKPTR